MTLRITADDFGYNAAYDRGIAAAAAAGAIDAVSAMVLRGSLDAGLLEGSGVEVGLHLERDKASLAEQVERFEAVFAREPTHIDGHHHCHARGPIAVEVANLARERDWFVRSVDERHRRLLRCKGVATADALVGRMAQDEPALPDEVGHLLRRHEGDEGSCDESSAIEWVAHPGYPDPATGSDYDAGREEDLALLLSLADEPALRAARSGHII